MVQTQPGTGPESRGGEQPDWAAVQPGKPLPENPKPGDKLRLHAEGVFSGDTLDDESTRDG